MIRDADNDNNLIVSVPIGDAVILALSNIDTAAGQWFNRISTFSGG